MSETDGPVELYRRYRPTKLDDVVGQDAAVKTLRGYGRNIPSALLFHGWTGTGKTTMARIVAGMLGLSTDDQFNYREVNCALHDSPLGMVQEIDASMRMSPLGARYKMYVLDEVQSLSRATFAQQALLKMLEDTPPHVRFALCTTDPKKVLAAVRGRCTPIEVKPIPAKLLAALARRTALAEGVEISDEVAERIAAVADGSAREALVQLQKVIGLKEEREQLAAVGGIEDNEDDRFGIVKALIPWNGRPGDWKSVAALLEEFKDEDPEGIRQMILASARAQLLKNGSKLAYRAIICLNEPFYDRASGRALLAAGCFEICNGAK